MIIQLWQLSDDLIVAKYVHVNERKVSALEDVGGNFWLEIGVNCSNFDHSISTIIHRTLTPREINHSLNFLIIYCYETRRSTTKTKQKQKQFSVFFLFIFRGILTYNLK